MDACEGDMHCYFGLVCYWIGYMHEILISLRSWAGHGLVLPSHSSASDYMSLSNEALTNHKTK